MKGKQYKPMQHSGRLGSIMLFILLHTKLYMRKQFLSLFLISFSISLFSQKEIWQPTDRETITQQFNKPDLRINDYLTFSLDTAFLKNILANFPHEAEVNIKEMAANFQIPTPDGGYISCKMVTYDMMEPELASRYPHIKTYYGVSAEDPSTRIRMDWTDFGLHTMIRGRSGTYYINPYQRNTKTEYIVFHKKDAEPWEHGFECGFDPDKTGAIPPKPFGKSTGDCQFRTYRLAQATTGEYSNYHGAFSSSQSNLVLSAITVVINRVNDVYEQDVAVRLIFISNTDQLFFYDPSTDPYTNNSGSMMLGQNQTTCDNIIGSPNYDIGHVFSTGGGGVAVLNSVCNNNHKAKGVTGLPNPVGDVFSIDYVSHEIGHQYGANHTQNNSCNRHNPSAMEPGSASTIMGYAGICPPNVQSNSDDYFHAISLSAIKNFLQSGGGSCATYPTYSNQSPVVSGGDSHFIPVSTPFILTASATDNDGDLLTYCWEQYDNQTGFPMPPQSTSTGGPMFRSLLPDISESRFMPNLNAVINNSTPTWEVVPSVGRTMNFRITVRDNHAPVGCLATDDIVVSTVSGTGPFLVQAPNTNAVVTSGQFYMVQWTVANTNNAPVSCSEVDILLSTDGGFNYNFVLAENIPNNGVHYVQMPFFTSTQCRVMVRCSGNIFYDISNVNFPLQSGPASFSIGAQPAFQSACVPGSSELTIESTSLSGFSGSINLSLFNAPSGVTASFNPNPISPGQSSTMTFNGLGNLPLGSQTFTVRGQSGGTIRDIQVFLDLEPGGVITTLVNPFDQEQEVSPVPEFSFSVTNGLGQNQIQVALDPDFNNIVIDENIFDSFYQTTSALLPQTTYYWRVRSEGNCGLGVWTSAWSFTTSACEDYVSVNVPIIIPSNQPATITSTLSVTSSGIIQDVNVVNIIGQHSRVGDLVFRIESPSGTRVTLMSQICGNNNHFFISFDDQASSGIIPCPPTNGQSYQPLQSLSAFHGENMLGIWTLEIQDVNSSNGGTLDGWGLDICAADLTFLSVDWLDFKVIPDANKHTALLQWITTNSEESIDFYIEKSSGNAHNFREVGHKDNPIYFTNELPVYEWEDMSVSPGIPHYYRIKQTDLSGNISYSSIRQVTLISSQKISVYPNPFQNRLFINYMDEYTLNTEVIITDITGRIVHSVKYKSSRIELPVDNLPSGAYILTIQMGNGESKRYRIVK
jgi:subtilisin-like proprotein convertase family protein